MNWKKPYASKRYFIKKYKLKSYHRQVLRQIYSSKLKLTEQALMAGHDAITKQQAQAAQPIWNVLTKHCIILCILWDDKLTLS